MPAIATVDRLPDRLPIFPLTGQLLLPGSAMPLHIFEPRYRAMTEDALAADQMIGMIQPLVPAADNRPQPDLFTGQGIERDDQGSPADSETSASETLSEETSETSVETAVETSLERGSRTEPASDSEAPRLYPIGCAGEIDRSKRLDDGRFVILLRGVCRFRITEELPLVRGYRRVIPAWDEFAADLDEESAGDSELRMASDLIQAVTAFAHANGLNLDVDRLDELTPRHLIDGLAAALPFEPAEKQALLEAVDLSHRLHLLTSLLSMASATVVDPDTSGLEN